LLAVLPFAWVALFVAAMLAAGDAHGAVVLRVEVEAAKLVSLAGGLIAAAAFDRGDYLRRGWALVATCNALLLVRDATLVPGMPQTVLGMSLATLQTLIITVGNASSVAGIVILARAWSVAGLEPAGSKLTRRSVMLGATLIALVVSGPAIIGDMSAITSGDGLTSLVSDAADAVSLVVIAPVLLTALALRGGVLRWPFGLLTASLIFWLGYDAEIGLRHVLGISRVPAAVITTEVFRGLALVFGFSAGIAQRLALTGADATIPPG
jgi:hypothetical protein